ncbi:hypothetical protein [Streptomyces sp. NPDC053069]|uniref:hypothetical protein n=1 Tax=Streptomyces sp. NPDC053069 TaxID=3365695 RepID=UPI0037CFC5D5
MLLRFRDGFSRFLTLVIVETCEDDVTVDHAGGAVGGGVEVAAGSYEVADVMARAAHRSI